MSEPGIESILSGIEKIADDLLTSDEERQKAALCDAPSSALGAASPAAGDRAAGDPSAGAPSADIPRASGLSAPAAGASLRGDGDAERQATLDTLRRKMAELLSRD